MRGQSSRLCSMMDKNESSADHFPQLYAYAKVAEGKDFSKAEKPGMFNLAVR